jgi:hypothetical protein
MLERRDAAHGRSRLLAQDTPMSRPNRRSFLATLSALAGLAAARPLAAHVSIRARSTSPAGESSEEWDLRWLDELRGKHKQVFDVGTSDGALHVVGNYLRAFREVFKLEYPQVNAVVGIAYTAFPVNASDALWEKYKLGERWKINHPRTGAPLTHNLFANVPPEAPPMFRDGSIPELKARGAIFWQCNNALEGVARELSRDTNQTFEAVRAELVAGLLPGVKLVPAHTMLLGLVQERGCTYEKI